MLSDYLQAAAHHATYEILEDDGDFFGEIPPCQGVHANGPTLEACRQELLTTLEDWVLFRIHRHLPLPVIDGLELTVKAEALKRLLRQAGISGHDWEAL